VTKDNKEKKNSIATKFKTTIFFENTNNEEIDSMVVTTN
jgi:hypothetical protein